MFNILRDINVTLFLGPLIKTLVDFQRLNWQEKPSIIVTVTNLKEDKGTGLILVPKILAHSMLL